MVRLGIDLGTTRSAIGLMEAGDPTLLQNSAGDRLTPSVVHYGDDDEVLVGKQAERKLRVESDRVVREIKRHMGEENYKVEIGDNEYTPAEVSSEVLSKLISDSEDVLNEPVDELVITVPAYFTADQKRDTREAAIKAGFDSDDIDLLKEPTAAALAYGYDEQKTETVLVYDFGGGTLDISVMDIEGNNFSMLATSGNTDLGGADFTQAIVDLLADDYEDENGIDLRSDDEAREKLRDVAEEVKIDLSSREKTEANSPYMGEIDGEIVGIEEKVVMRDEFEDAVDELIDQAIDPIEEALDKAGLKQSDIDNVLLVGGSSKIPAIQQRIEDFLGFEPTTTNDLDRIVAYGAAILAGSDEDVTEKYVCPSCDFDVATIGRLFGHIVEEHGAEECPFSDCDEETSDEDELKSHLANDHGADIAASTTGGGVGPDKIGNILTRSLGTDVEGGKMDIIIEQGTELSAENTRAYTTTEDNQTVVPVNVYQGESEYLEDNVELHSWHVEGIPEMDAGEPIVKVTFKIDENEILEVTARETKSGTEAKTVVHTDGQDVTADEDPEKAEAN